MTVEHTSDVTKLSIFENEKALLPCYSQQPLCGPLAKVVDYVGVGLE